MNINPTVSIIIPYHRKKNFFFKTINSILKQSFKNYEIIIIYDDNKYNELSYIKKYFKEISKNKNNSQ